MGNTIQIAADVRALRKVHHKTLADISAQTGLSVSYLSDIERGVTTPTIATLEKIVAVYGIRLRIVLDWSHDA